MLPRLQDARVQRLRAVVAVEQAAPPAAGRAVGGAVAEQAARVAAVGGGHVHVVVVEAARACAGAGDGAVVGRDGRHIAVAVEEAVLARGGFSGHGLGLVDGLWGGLAAAEERHGECWYVDPWCSVCVCVSGWQKRIVPCVCNCETEMCNE